MERAAPLDEPAYFAPDESPLGTSYQDWLAAYWQWHLSLPRTDHPREGGDCAQGQSSGEHDAWFLVTGRNGRTEQRSCTVPADRVIWVIANSTLDFPRADCAFCTEEDDGPEAWFAGVPDVLDELAEHLEPNTPVVELDGEPLPIGERYFFRTEAPFLAEAPTEDPYFSCTGPFSQNACGWQKGSSRPFVSVGYAIMLRPLQRGKHELRVGALSPSGDWKTDLTYLLTIE